MYVHIRVELCLNLDDMSTRYMQYIDKKIY